MLGWVISGLARRLTRGADEQALADGVELGVLAIHDGGAVGTHVGVEVGCVCRFGVVDASFLKLLKEELSVLLCLGVWARLALLQACYRWEELTSFEAGLTRPSCG